MLEYKEVGYMIRIEDSDEYKDLQESLVKRGELKNYNHDFTIRYISLDSGEENEIRTRLGHYKSFELAVEGIKEYKNKMKEILEADNRSYDLYIKNKKFSIIKVTIIREFVEE